MTEKMKIKRFFFYFNGTLNLLLKSSDRVPTCENTDLKVLVVIVYQHLSSSIDEKNEITTTAIIMINIMEEKDKMICMISVKLKDL